MKIGISGLGCVGQAYANIVNKKENLYVYDIRTPTQYDKNNYYNWCSDLNELAENSSIILLCLPTPEGKDGRSDISAHLETLELLKETSYTGSVVIKSTITPDVLERLFNRFCDLQLAYSPEFLREATAFQDLLETDMHFVAGNDNACKDYQQFIKESKTQYNECKIVSSFKELSLMKYTINSFLATKVIFFNALYDACEKEGVDYDSLLELVKHDGRIGTSHMRVPGTDGNRGFGGMCFPKDTKAFKTYAGIAPETAHMSDLLETVIDINQKLR